MVIGRSCPRATFIIYTVGYILDSEYLMYNRKYITSIVQHWDPDHVSATCLTNCTKQK